LNTY
jgi:hypothetical protein